MQVFVNNKEVDTQATTLSTLIEQLGMPAQGVAAAVDNKMVPRTQLWRINTHLPANLYPAVVGIS